MAKRRYHSREKQNVCFAGDSDPACWSSIMNGTVRRRRSLALLDCFRLSLAKRGARLASVSALANRSESTCFKTSIFHTKRTRLSAALGDVSKVDIQAGLVGVTFLFFIKIQHV